MLPPEFRDILLLALLNPAVVAVGFLMGRRADQVQKLVIAGFIAALAGAVLVWLLMMTGVLAARPRLLMGIFIVGGFAGTLAAWLGWRTRAS